MKMQPALRFPLLQLVGGKPVGPLQPLMPGIVEFEQGVLPEGTLRAQCLDAERGMRHRRNRFPEQPDCPVWRERGRRVANRQIDAVATQVDKTVIGTEPYV